MTCGYGSEAVLVDVDLAVHRGEFIGIVGPSGAGKTTALRVLSGSLRVAHGSVTRRPGLRMAYVPQVETINWSFPVTVRECLLMARVNGRRLPWASRAERAQIEAVLAQLDIGELADRHIRELSGGQQQRVFIARALVGEPELLLMDEPTSGVDVRLRHEILHLLDELNDRGLAIVLSTHDLNGIAAHLPRVVCLNRRVIGDGVPHDVLTTDVLERTYGASMEVLVHGGMPVVVDNFRHHTPHEHPHPHPHHAWRWRRARPCARPRRGPCARRGAEVIDELLRPFDFEFFRNGLIVATMAGALCGAIGVYVVLKGMSYIGHGLSHAIFGGFAASSLLGVNYLLGAGLWGVVSALMINAVTRRRIIGSDAAIGVITTASFALGLALFALFGTSGRSFDAALFGSILGVGTDDVIAIFVVSILAGVLIFLRYRALLFTTFDPEVADVAGVNTARMDALLMVVLAGSILATMQVLGVTLIAAALVIPAAVARMLTNSFARMLQLATGIGAVCGFVGMNLSYHLDVQSGPTIVLVAATLFAAVFVFTGFTGRRRTAGLAAS